MCLEASALSARDVRGFTGITRCRRIQKGLEPKWNSEGGMSGGGEGRFSATGFRGCIAEMEKSHLIARVSRLSGIGFSEVLQR